MLKNTGREYELLVRTILAQAHEQEGVLNLTTEHDVDLPGVILTHQIDVLIRFEVASIPYTVVVQCKDWNSRVKQEQMLTFAHVLDDLPGQPRGVFVTRKGYQAGAKKLAADRGIILYTLREPTCEDGLVSKVIINLTLYADRSSDPIISPDTAWLLEARRRQGIPRDEQINLQFVRDRAGIVLYDEDGAPKHTLQDIHQLLSPPGLVEVPRHHAVHYFTEPTYIATSGDPRLPRIRIASVESDVEVVALHSIHEVQSDNLAAYILEDVLAGKKTTINRELRFLTHYKES